MAAGKAGESRLVRFSVTHPWRVIVLIAAAVALACVFIPRIELRLDARALVPEGHSALRSSDASAERFRRRDVVVVAVEARDVLAPAALAEVARVTRELESRPEIDPDSIVSLATWPVVDGDGRLTSLTRVAPAEAQRLANDLAQRDGVLISKDGRTTLLFAEVHPGADRYALLDLFRGRLATGTALAQATLGRAVATDLLRMVPAVLLVIGLVLGIAFRRASPALLALAEIGVSLLLTAGIMGLFRASLFVTTLVLPVVLIAVGVSDDVHALRHFYSSRRAGSAADRITVAFTEMLPAVRLTAMTTIAGLLSLALTPLRPMRVFGIHGSVAITCSTLMTFTLLPALLVLVERRRGGTDAPEPSLAMGWVLRSRVLVALFLIVLAVSIALLPQLTIDDDWIANIPPQSEVARADAILNRDMAGTTTVDLDIDCGDDGVLDPATLVRLGRLAETLRAAQGVGAVTSVFDDVCRIQACLRGERFTDLRDGVLRGTRSLTRADVEQSIFLLSSLRRPPLHRRVDSFRHTRMTLFIRNADYRTLAPILESAERNGMALFGANAVTPFGDGWVSQQTVRILVEGQIRGVPFAILADLLLLAILLRSLRKAVVVLIPVVAASVFVLALFAATTTPLGIAASMFTGIALGIGTDFAVHLLSAAMRGDSPAVAASSVLISAAAMVLGFGVLFLSAIPTTLRMAASITSAVAACAINAMIVVRIPSRRRAEGDGFNAFSSSSTAAARD